MVGEITKNSSGKVSIDVEVRFMGFSATGKEGKEIRKVINRRREESGKKTERKRLYRMYSTGRKLSAGEFKPDQKLCSLIRGGEHQSVILDPVSEP